MLEGDTPTVRQTIDQLPEAVAEAVLQGIQTRRLQAFQVYEKNRQEAKAVQDARLKLKMEKQLTILQRELDSLDKLIDKVEKRCLNVRAIRLEID